MHGLHVGQVVAFKSEMYLTCFYHSGIPFDMRDK